MILIHGDCGAGKSAALHALDAVPPAGFRAVYVPVPTLDFSGLARWCLDRLGVAAEPEPIAALREALKRLRVVLLIDDADRMPLDAALAVRQLERDGALALVAACGSDQQHCPAIVALGAPAHAIAIAPNQGEAGAAEVRDRLTPPTAARLASPRRAAPEPPRAAFSELPPRVAMPSAAAIPQPSLALEPALAPMPTRTVPLSLAIAMACAAFLIPAAFFGGFLLGGSRRDAAASGVAVSRALPVVSAAPRERPSEPPQQLGSPGDAEPVAHPRISAPAATAAPEIRESASRGREAALSQAEPAPPPPALATDVARVPAPVARAVPPSIQRRPQERATGTKSRASEGWDAPALISVEPPARSR